MKYKLGVPTFGRFFNMPCGAVDNYLKIADGNFYKVLLAALCSDTMIIDTDILAERCGVDASVAEEALLFWGSTGVVDLVGTDMSMAVSAAASPVSAVPAAVASVPQDTVPEPVSTVEAIAPTKNTVQRSHIRYSPKELAQKAKDDKNVRVLFEEIQKVFGRTINATDSAALVDIYEYYGYDVPTILILAEYCSGLGKTRLAYLQAVVRDWFERGITNYEQVEQEIIRLTKQNNIDHKLCCLLGIQEPPTKRQKEYFSTWTDWGYGVDMIGIAGEKCRDQKNKTDLRYMNGIIKRWHNDGIYTPQALKLQEQDHAKQTVTSAAANEPSAGGERSYDLGKWYQMAETLDFDNLNFGSGDKE